LGISLKELTTSSAVSLLLHTKAAFPGDVIGGEEALDKEGKYRQLRERAWQEGELMRS